MSTGPARQASAWAAFTRTRASGFALIVLCLLLWEVSTRLGWVVSDNFPPFSQVLVAGAGGLASGELLQVLGSSLYRMLAGYVIACVAGVAFGLVLGMSRLLDTLVRPLIEVLRTLPSPAIVPPLILFLGVDDALKICIIGLAAFFPVFVNTFGGVRSVDETMRLTARTLGLSASQTLRKIMLPAVLPSALAGMRISLSLSLVITVVAEMISGASGVGYFLNLMQYALRADLMYAAIIGVSAAGYLLNRLFLAAERRVLHWHPSARGDAP